MKTIFWAKGNLYPDFISINIYYNLSNFIPKLDMLVKLYLNNIS